MILTIDSLKQVGAFTGAPVEKEITWKQGDQELKATVFVRPLGYHLAVANVQAITGKVEGVAARIAAAICDENGKPIFTVQDIVEGPLDPDEIAKDEKSTKRLGPLSESLTMALLVAIGEANKVGKMKS